jgi:hypothetical protein
MTSIEANQAYFLQLDESFSPTNISYTGSFYDILPNQFVIIKHRLAKKPDRVNFYNSILSGVESNNTLTINNNNGDWHWDNSSFIFSYIIHNRAAVKPFLDVGISFSAIKCRYESYYIFIRLFHILLLKHYQSLDCIPPSVQTISSSIKPAITKRPPEALFWSNVSTWTKINPAFVSIPDENANVIIPSAYYVVLDVPYVKLTTLTIEGVLEFDNVTDNLVMEADMIFINGGQLIIGWEDDPFLKNVYLYKNY